MTSERAIRQRAIREVLAFDVLDRAQWSAAELEALVQPKYLHEWTKLSLGEQSEKFFNLIRTAPDRPCPTIVACYGTTAAGPMHPWRPRKFTLAELRRICSFPDDFELPGGYRTRCERLGRSVPPVMMATIAATIAETLLGEEAMRMRQQQPRRGEPAKPVKPPYHVPSMAEIAAVIGSNGLEVVSTFSGCGGSCLGFEMAGYRVRWANEFVQAARETYALNHPDVVLDARDIREIKPEEILRAIGKRVGEVDVLEGSPPCASFSLAGKREKHWGQVRKYSDTSQRTDDLFDQYIRLLDGLKPRVFVAENVSGLVKGNAYGYFEMILRAMRKCGYRVRARMLDAKWLGVPQERLRMIFMGVRDDLERDPVFPKPLPYCYSIRDALPWVSKIDGRTGPGFERVETEVDEPMNTILSTDPRHTRYRVRGKPLSFEKMAIMREWKKLMPGEYSGRYLSLGRPRADWPCPTITAVGHIGSASITHPDEPRKFYIEELRRICGFPDDFQLTGRYDLQWERLGRAVPPVMMCAVASTIRDRILAVDRRAE